MAAKQSKGVFGSPNLLGLPDTIKSRILTMILTPENSDKAFDYICPFYEKGFWPDLSVFTLAELTCFDKYGLPRVFVKKRNNLDLALLQLNRESNKSFSRALYGKNVFVFNDARSCLWFVKHIGKQNLCNLTSVVFNFSSGYVLSGRNRSAFDVCEERLWCAVLLFLRHRHRIQHCAIRFVRFNGLEEREDLSDDDKLDITASRCDLVRLLSTIHGMENVYLENEQCRFLGYAERVHVARNMRHRVDPTDGMTILSEQD